MPGFDPRDPRDPSTFPTLGARYCFEVEFMVAKELLDVEYDVLSDNTDDSLNVIAWNCPADEQDPYRAILNECKNLLFNKNNEPVTVCYDPSCPDTETKRYDMHDGGKSLRFGAWYLEPSVTARPTADSPSNYDWLGVRLRSPLVPYTAITHHDPTAKWVMGVLRLGLMMHVNSSCRFKVHIAPAPGPLTPLVAKKLTTLVWLTEKELLLRLCPNNQGVPFPHVKPIDTHSRISAASWRGREDSRPEDPLRAGIMDQYLPPLRDKVMQERLHSVWGTATVEELAKALSCNDGQPASFALRLHDDPLDAPTIEFSYALWHPYSQLDASNYWVQLAMQFYFFAISCSAKPFVWKQFIRDVEELIKGFFSKGVPAASRWKILLEKLDLAEDWSSPWEKIIDEYKTGRLLAHPSIERHGILGQIDELKIYERR